MENSNINMIIGIIVVVVMVVIVGLGIGIGMKKSSESNQQANTSNPTSNEKVENVTPSKVVSPQVNMPAPAPAPFPTGESNPSPLDVPPIVESSTPLPDIQPGFNPTIVQVGPIDPNNILGVKDEGFANLSKDPYQYATISSNLDVIINNLSQPKNPGYFQKGTYPKVGTDSKVFCREIGSPRFVSCGVPGNPYKYMPPNSQSGPLLDPGHEAFRGMFEINGTGDKKLDGKIVFCRGAGTDSTNPQMSCIGLNADGSWNYANQNMGLGKLGNALDYFQPPPPPPQPELPGCPLQ